MGPASLRPAPDLSGCLPSLQNSQSSPGPLSADVDGQRLQVEEQQPAEASRQGLSHPRDQIQCQASGRIDVNSSANLDLPTERLTSLRSSEAAPAEPPDAEQESCGQQLLFSELFRLPSSVAGLMPSEDQAEEEVDSHLALNSTLISELEFDESLLLHVLEAPKAECSSEAAVAAGRNSCDSSSEQLVPELRPSVASPEWMAPSSQGAIESSDIILRRERKRRRSASKVRGKKNVPC